MLDVISLRVSSQICHERRHKKNGTICRKAEGVARPGQARPSRLLSGFALGQSLGPRGADRPRAQIHLATPEAFRQTVILSNFRKS